MNKETILKKIIEKNYVGYIWGSNSKEPIVLNAKHVSIADIDVKGYIIEALLYCEEDNTSLIIRHSGKYHMHEFKLDEFGEENLLDVEYLPHRLNGVEKVCFKQLWLPEQDEHCEDMEVLKMKALVFTGFNCKNTKS